jgi:DNA-binding NarL/FixJ family response regulator
VKQILKALDVLCLAAGAVLLGLAYALPGAGEADTDGILGSDASAARRSSTPDAQLRGAVASFDSPHSYPPLDACCPTPETARLSHRELEVTRLVAQGLTNRQVAERLNVSRRTVDHHVARILRKLDATNRTVAVLAAERLGVLGAGLSDT